MATAIRLPPCTTANGPLRKILASIRRCAHSSSQQVDKRSAVSFPALLIPLLANLVWRALKSNLGAIPSNNLQHATRRLDSPVFLSSHLGPHRRPQLFKLCPPHPFPSPSPPPPQMLGLFAFCLRSPLPHYLGPDQSSIFRNAERRLPIAPHFSH